MTEELSGEGRVLTFDLEAIGLLDTIIENRLDSLHIIHAKDKLSGELFTFFDKFDDRVEAEWLDGYEEGFASGTILQGIKFLMEAKCLIIQNGIGFDFPAFEKVYPDWEFDYFAETGDPKYPFKCMDTFLMSSLLNPERKLDQRAYRITDANGKSLANTGPHRS